MRYRSKCWFAAAGVLAGCVSPPPVTEPASLTPAQLLVVQNAVRVELKDPYSAMFGGYRASRHQDGHLTVCGYVNARNSYGGYAGQQPYLGALTNGQFDVVAVGLVGTDNYALLATCRRGGAGI